MALPASHRLKKDSDFKHVLKTGRTVRGDFLFLKFAPRQGAARIGISVSAKISKKSVIRNQTRRWISEIIRLTILPKAGGYDTVIVVTRNGLDNKAMLERDLVNSFRRAGIT